MTCLEGGDLTVHIPLRPNTNRPIWDATLGPLQERGCLSKALSRPQTCQGHRQLLAGFLIFFNFAAPFGASSDTTISVTAIANQFLHGVLALQSRCATKIRNENWTTNNDNDNGFKNWTTNNGNDNGFKKRECFLSQSDDFVGEFNRGPGLG